MKTPTRTLLPTSSLTEEIHIGVERSIWEEISTKLNIPVNSIGPVLSRARKKLRDDARTSGKAKPAEHAAAEAPKSPPG